MSTEGTSTGTAYVLEDLRGAGRVALENITNTTEISGGAPAPSDILQASVWGNWAFYLVAGVCALLIGAYLARRIVGYMDRDKVEEDEYYYEEPEADPVIHEQTDIDPEFKNNLLDVLVDFDERLKTIEKQLNIVVVRKVKKEKTQTTPVVKEKEYGMESLINIEKQTDRLIDIARFLRKS